MESEKSAPAFGRCRRQGRQNFGLGGEEESRTTGGRGCARYNTVVRNESTTGRMPGQYCERPRGLPGIRPKVLAALRAGRSDRIGNDGSVASTTASSVFQTRA